MEVPDFTRQVIHYLKLHRAALEKAGLDVDFMIRQLESLLEELGDTAAHLEDLKRQTLKLLSKPKDEQPGTYTAPAEHLDMAADALRNGEDVIKYFERLRRRSRRPSSDEKAASGRNDSN